MMILTLSVYPKIDTFGKGDPKISKKEIDDSS